MMQTELMLRLLFNGKIVGYEWHRVLDGAEHMTIWYRDEGGTTWSHGGYEIDHNAVERGERVGDEWVFGEYKYVEKLNLYEFIESESI